MARIWKYGMIIVLVYGLINHHQEEMMTSLYDTPFIVLELVTTIILSACLWGGFLHIIEHTGFIHYFSPLLKPLLKIMYKDDIHHQHVYDYLSTNMIANVLGLSSLATLSGIKAIQALEKYNQHSYPSKSQFMLVISNGAGICLFPSSIIMLRNQFASYDVYSFYPYMLIISLIVFIIAIVIVRLKNE